MGKKEYLSLFDFKFLNKDEKEYFERMLGAISEVDSAKEVLNSLLKSRSKDEKIKIRFNCLQDEVYGEAYTEESMLCISCHPETQDDSNYFFEHACYFAHELTHFDVADKLKQIKSSLSIKQRVISNLCDEAQARFIEKDCYDHFKKKSPTLFLINAFRFGNISEVYPAFLKGEHWASGTYIDDELYRLNPSRIRYGVGVENKKFYSFIRENFSQIPFVPENENFKWEEKKSDGLSWIKGEEISMLVDGKGDPVYTHIMGQRNPDGWIIGKSQNYIYSKKQNISGDVISPEMCEKEDVSCFTEEEALAYQKFCDHPFYAMGNSLACLFSVALCKSKTLLQEKLHLRQLLTNLSSKGEEKRQEVSQKQSKNRSGR